LRLPFVWWDAVPAGLEAEIVVASFIPASLRCVRSAMRASSACSRAETLQPLQVPDFNSRLLELFRRRTAARAQEQFRILSVDCHNRKESRQEENSMLGWAVTFLIVALIAAVLGFGGIAGTAIEIAKIIFFVAIVLFAIAAIVGLVRGRTPTVP
jgi:uncharacterized membrane protein YtjA (UPF0391 family)